MKLGEKLYALRKQKGLTLEEVGNFVGVGKSTVRKWENGIIENMRRDKIAKLAQCLGVSPSYIMGWEGHTNNGIINGIIGDQNHNNIITLDPRRVLNPADSAILTICENLNDKQKGEVLTFATQLLSKKGE